MNFMFINLFIRKLIFTGNAIYLSFYQLIFQDPVYILNLRIFSRATRTRISIFPHRFLQAFGTHQIVAFAFSALFWLSQKIFTNSTLNLWENISESFEVSYPCFSEVEISSIFFGTTVHLITSMVLRKLISIPFNATEEAIKRIVCTFVNVMSYHFGLDYSKLVALFASSTLFFVSFKLIIVQNFLTTEWLQPAFQLDSL